MAGGRADWRLKSLVVRWSQNTTLLLALIVVVAVALRLGLAVYYGNGFTEFRGGTYDQVSYDALARRVLAGQGFSFGEDWWPYARANQPTAFWSFLYTLYLAAVYALFGAAPVVARIIQSVVVGVIMPLAAFGLGYRVFGRRVGLIAAAIMALYLYYISYAAALMTESFYVSAILLSLLSAIALLDRLDMTAGEDAPGGMRRKRLLGYGFLLGLFMGTAILLRQVVAVYFVALLVFIVLTGMARRQLALTILPVLVAGAVVLIMASPVLVRNYRVFDRPTSLNTNAGFAFFWANHPIYGAQFEAVLDSSHGLSYQELIPEEFRQLDEAALDRALLQRGLEFVVQEPARYVRLSLSRIAVYFLFWPTADSSTLSNVARVASFGLVLPLALLGLALAVWRTAAGRGNGRRPGTGPGEQSHPGIAPRNMIILIGFVVLYSAIHILSWANVRYRLPVDAVLILFAAYGIDQILARVRQRPERPG